MQKISIFIEVQSSSGDSMGAKVALMLDLLPRGEICFSPSRLFGIKMAKSLFRQLLELELISDLSSLKDEAVKVFLNVTLVELVEF